MRMRGVFQVLGVLAMFLVPTGVGAREQGVIFGTVTEAGTDAPVVDVVVTVTSPVLQGEQTVETDALGRYRTPELPPGEYTVRFEKELFKPYARSAVPRREGHSTRLDVSLIREALEEEIVIACGPATVDTSSASVRRPLYFDFDTPNFPGRSSGPLGMVRSAEDLALMVPGVLDTAEGLSISGASSFENEVLLDGLSTRAVAPGFAPLLPSLELLSVTAITSGGLPAQSGRTTGGHLELVTQSGSNELHGSVFGFWTPGLLEGRRGASGDALKHLGDFGATLGGPVLKDSLWFFAGVTPALSRVERSPSGTFVDARSLQALGKLTYLINHDHNVTLSLLTAPSTQEGSSADATRTVLQYQAAFLDKKLFVDTHAGWLSQRVSPSEDGSADATLDRYQVNTLATLHAYTGWGYHLLKAGVDAERLTHAQAGTRTPSHLFGGFVQDSWSFLNRFTVHAGARYDVQHLGSGSVTAARLSPRVGLVVDPRADGRMRVFAHYGRLQGLIPLGLPDATLDPELEPVSADEVITGIEYELMAFMLLGGTYTHRELDRGLGLTPRTDGTGVVLGNPGFGLLADSPRAARTYQAVTVELRRHYWEGWQGQVSYTWSKLTGTPMGSLSPWEGLDSTRRLPLDRPHVLRAYGAREFRFGPRSRLRADVGASYMGASGLGMEGSEKRTPWVQSLDVHLGLRYRLDGEQQVTFRLDAFNVLNAQEATWADERDTVPVRHQLPRQVRLGVHYDF
jgi:hypothetical protein